MEVTATDAVIASSASPSRGTRRSCARTDARGASARHAHEGRVEQGPDVPSEKLAAWQPRQPRRGGVDVGDTAAFAVPREHPVAGRLQDHREPTFSRQLDGALERLPEELRQEDQGVERRLARAARLAEGHDELSDDGDCSSSAFAEAPGAGGARPRLFLVLPAVSMSASEWAG